MAKLNGKDIYLSFLKGKSFEHKGEYDATAIYQHTSQIVDCVLYNGASYYCKQTTTAGIDPTNNEYWGVMASGNINPDTINFAESERQKSKNLFNINATRKNTNANSSVSNNTLNVNGTSADTYTIYVIDVKPNTNYTVSSNVEIVTSNNYTGRIGIFNEAVSKYIDSFEPNNNSVVGTFNTGDNSKVSVIFYSATGGSYTKSEVNFSNIQIEEGTVATDYHKWSGKTLHEEDLEPNLLYDKDNKQTIGGVAYPNGIGNGNAGTYTINNIDLTPYKYMYVYQRMYGEIHKIFVDLTSSVDAGGYCGGHSTLSYNIDAIDCSLVKIPTTKDSITFDVRYIRLSDVSIQGTPVNVCRIEVYK